MSPTQITQLIRSFPCLRSKLPNYAPEPFDPDAFHELIGPWSHGERLCALFILNVWNPLYAKVQGWQFNLFRVRRAGRRRQQTRSPRLDRAPILAMTIPNPFPAFLLS